VESITIELTPALAEALAAEKEGSGRSMQGIARRALTYYLRRHLRVTAPEEYAQATAEAALAVAPPAEEGGAA
jgi:hypothetical protein